MSDKDLIRKAFELGAVLGKGIEIQFTSLMPLSVGFESRSDDFRDEVPVSSNVAVNWLSDVRQRLDELRLSSSSAYRQCSELAKHIDNGDLRQTEALSFGDTLDQWCKELSFALTGRTALLPHPTCDSAKSVFKKSYIYC